jgi:perosamine synthetase
MIPVCEPVLDGKELEYVADCVKTTWISSNGKYISLFEKKFAEFCQTNYGVACNNGTTAIHLALEALGIGKNDEVIIPTFTMIATCNAVIYSGAKPVLVDAEMETWNIDTDLIEDKITPRTKAILVVHTYGHAVDMDPILEIAKKHNLFVVEDAAEAHGGEYKEKRCGSLGDIGCFSFYSNKIITTGEGGMVVTNNAEYAERAQSLRNHAFGKPRFIHNELGFNYRITNIQAAIGLAQMERADYLVNRRIKNAMRYNSLLKDVEGIKIPPEKAWAKNVYWMYSILIEDSFGLSKDDVMEKLRDKGVDTRSFFYGMHQQPVFKNNGDDRYPDCHGSYPVADELTRKGLYLPSSGSLTEDNIETVVQAIKSLKG